MSPIDLRILYSALGFNAVIMQGKDIFQKDGAFRATALANLIEEFCRVTLPEISSVADVGKETIAD